LKKSLKSILDKLRYQRLHALFLTDERTRISRIYSKKGTNIWLRSHLQIGPFVKALFMSLID
jgi:hypothetical protein